MLIQDGQAWKIKWVRVCSKRTLNERDVIAKLGLTIMHPIVLTKCVFVIEPIWLRGGDSQCE